MAKRKTPSTVLITGASSGIGRAVALEYAKRGAHVMAVARREAELSSLCTSIEATGGRASFLTCDVADKQAAFDIVKKAESVLGSLDLVIANAGVGRSRHASRLSMDEVTQSIDINVTGAIATLLAAVPVMMGQGHGHLVGVTSLAGRRALPGSSIYGATKAALSHFLEGLRIDLAPAGLSVTDVQPGFVDTPMTQVNDFPMPFMWDASKAARYIADRLESAPGIVAFPLPLRFLTRLSQVVPFALHSNVTRMMSAKKR